MFKSRYVVIAAAGLLLLGWLAFRHSPIPAPSESVGIQSEAGTPVKDDALPIASEPATSAPIPSTRPLTNLLARIMDGEQLTVTAEQLASYLEKSHRDAGSLLAAFQATQDRALLEEAISKYPNDPRVAYTAWYRSQPASDDPEGVKARRQALDTLKQAAPDNSLANYLSAANYFKSGEPALAISEMQAGASKVGFSDYTHDAIQNMTEAYMAAGYSEAESKAAASMGALLPDMAELKQDGVRLVDLAKSYQQNGDTASAQAVLQMCQDLGRRLDDANSLSLIQPLVGIALQRMALNASGGMPIDTDTTQSVEDQLQAFTQRREQFKAWTRLFDEWVQSATPEDVVLFYDRQHMFGEQNALQWLENRKAP
jgi:hypothetical protein